MEGPPGERLAAADDAELQAKEADAQAEDDDEEDVVYDVEDEAERMMPFDKKPAYHDGRIDSSDDEAVEAAGESATTLISGTVKTVFGAGIAGESDDSCSEIEPYGEEEGPGRLVVAPSPERDEDEDEDDSRRGFSLQQPDRAKEAAYTVALSRFVPASSAEAGKKAAVEDEGIVDAAAAAVSADDEAATKRQKLDHTGGAASGAK